MNLEIENPPTYKLSAELGQRFTWGRKLNTAASTVVVSSLAKAAAKAAESPMKQRGVLWELKPGSLPLQRLLLRTRKGECWSYPYGFLTLIEFTTPQRLHLHCNSGEVEMIEIHGTGLDKLFMPLCEHRVVMLMESDNTLVSRDGLIVKTITVVASATAKKEPRAE